MANILFNRPLFLFIDLALLRG